MIAAIEDKVSDIDLADVDKTLESLAWSPEYYQFKPL